MPKQNTPDVQAVTVSGGSPLHSPAASFLVLLLVNAMWAFQFSGAKIVMEKMGPISTALVPLAISTLIFAPFLASRKNQSQKTKLTPHLLWRLFAIGSLGVLPAQLGLTWGVEHSLASNAAVITLTVPVLTAIFASILLHEKMTKLRWVSFALAIVGVGIVSRGDVRSSALLHSGFLAGNLLILVSCVGSAFNNTYSKKLLESLNPLELLVYSFLVADVELLLLMTVFERRAFGQFGSLDSHTWIGLALIAVFSLSVSMMLYFWVIQRIDVMQASLSVYLLPIFGVFFSWLLLHERVTGQLLAGAALVFFATFLITVQEGRQKAMSEAAAEEVSTLPLKD
ncbi:MAG: DMT family transporter [Bryocella sp.]